MQNSFEMISSIIFKKICITFVLFRERYSNTRYSVWLCSFTVCNVPLDTLTAICFTVKYTYISLQTLFFPKLKTLQFYRPGLSSNLCISSLKYALGLYLISARKAFVNKKRLIDLTLICEIQGLNLLYFSKWI